MSEYQYYEFQTVDDRLTEKEMRELRGFSSRATITPTGFTNEYNFGSFKGDADVWMEKYFDGYFYLANWGTRELQLALPAKVLPLKTAGRYCSGEAASGREKSGRSILKFFSQDESGGDWIEGGGHLSSLLQIRNELAGGDLRGLYLGWLMRVQAGELDESDEEPPVPPNLGALSGPQANFAELFYLDPDLVAVAAQNSPQAKIETANREELSSWIASLPAREKDDILVRLATGGESNPGMELEARFRRAQAKGGSAPMVKPRTVSELLKTAEARGREREREQARKAAEAKAERGRQAAIAREKHLDSLKGRGGTIWTAIETLVATRLPKNYDQVALHLGDLRELAEREGDLADFKRRLADLRTRHSGKKMLIERLVKL